MAIRFVEIHAAANPAELNTEWVVLENDGKLPFVTRGCGMTVGRRGQSKRKELGIIDPGFVLAPGTRVRMLPGRSPPWCWPSAPGCRCGCASPGSRAA